MDESLEGMAWLISQLEANATITVALAGGAGGIFPLQAPEGAPVPFCVVAPMGGHDVKGVASYRLMYEGPYKVQFWGFATQSDTLTSLINAADALLQPSGHASSGNSPDGHAQILSCVRDNPLPVLPSWDGQQLRVGVGGLYRLQIRSLT